MRPPRKRAGYRPPAGPEDVPAGDRWQIKPDEQGRPLAYLQLIAGDAVLAYLPMTPIAIAALAELAQAFLAGWPAAQPPEELKT